MKAYTLPISEVFKKINSSENGLNYQQVEQNAKKYGKNIVTPTKKKSLFKRITDALLEPMLIILEIAFCITIGVNIGKYFKNGNGDFYECFGIFIAIFISVALTIYMEGKSNTAFELLSKMYEGILVKVKRKGVVELINKNEVVVGDIVLFESGDKIIADGRIINSNSLEVDESTLTGESVPIKKDERLVFSELTPLAERKNMAYSGSFVVAGSGSMVVTSVGDSAETGKIAKDLYIKDCVSAPLQEKLDRLGKIITIFGTLSAIFVLMLSITRLFITSSVSFESVEEAFLSSIILIVASVPEGLPTTVAISLTLNVLKLSKSNALIKKLVATETVGCVSVICSDKTGTLTENKMKVVSIYSGSEQVKKSVPSYIIYNASINSTIEFSNSKIIGQVTEKAIINAFLKQKEDVKDIKEKNVVTNRLEFSSKNKYMATSVKDITYFKGAPEIILNMCSLSKTEKTKIENAIYLEEEKARRIIAFAHIDLEDISVKENLVFDGFICIADTVRKDVKNSILECQNAGIGVKMLTGDNLYTAYAIAKELNICKNKSEIVTSNDIEKLTDNELKQKLPSIMVVARSTPQTKLRVVKLLKELGEVVAVTGDGINDAPAIKQADIGIAMGLGSEITKEASDIILLDNSFSTIVKAIFFGRNIYRNFQRFIMFQLSVNLTAVLFIILSMLFGTENPFTTIQLLWINIIMDGPPALSLCLEVRDMSIMSGKPVKRTDNIINKKMFIRIFLHSFLVCFILLLQQATNFIGARKEQNSTVIFSLFIIFQLFNAFNCRETGSVSAFKNLKNNKLMLYTFIVTFLLHILITNCFCKFFGTVSLEFVCWLKIIITSSTIIIISELYKFIYRLINNQNIIQKSLIKSRNNA